MAKSGKPTGSKKPTIPSKTQEPKPSPRTDWERLEREFILNPDYSNVRTWFREVRGWPENILSSGNFYDHTEGWGSKRAEFQQKITQQALEAAKATEAERVPKLYTAKLNLVAQIIQDVGSWKKLSSKDKKLCYDILKTELGEPSRISKQDIVSDGKPFAILGGASVQGNDSPKENPAADKAN